MTDNPLEDFEALITPDPWTKQQRLLGAHEVRLIECQDQIIAALKSVHEAFDPIIATNMARSPAVAIRNWAVAKRDVAAAIAALNGADWERNDEDQQNDK